MRRALSWVMLVVGVLAPQAAAGQEFEGTVNMTMTMPGMGGFDVVSHAKAGKVRQEMSMMGQDAVTIIDTQAGVGLTLMPSQRMYMKMDFNALAERAQQDSLPEPTLTALGTSDTILGHRCDNYRVTVPNGTMEICAATDLGFYMGSVTPPGGQLGQSGSMDAFAGVVRRTFPKGYFPLRTITTSQGMSMTMLVTKIERKSLPDDLFSLQVPEGYTEMRLPGGPSGIR